MNVEGSSANGILSLGRPISQTIPIYRLDRFYCSNLHSKHANRAVNFSLILLYYHLKIYGICSKFILILYIMTLRSLLGNLYWIYLF